MQKRFDSVYIVQVFVSAVFFCCGLCGCAVVDFVMPERSPNDVELSEGYYETELKLSSSAEVLAKIGLPEHELLSQSKKVIASLGQGKKGYKTWLKIAAFDENELTARRKYLFIVDEKPRVLFVEPRANIRFKCEMVLGEEVLNKPYAKENARRIAILRQVMEDVQQDISEVSQDDKMIDICGMLVNQAISTVLVELDSSPVLARRMSEQKGLVFEHTSFDKGRIHMFVEADIVSIELNLGSVLKGRLQRSGGGIKYERGGI